MVIFAFLFNHSTTPEENSFRARNKFKINTQ